MATFDIVCEVDMQEVDNAVNQASKEIGTRYDFRGSKSSIELDRTTKMIKLVADDKMKLRALHEILEAKLARRKVDGRALKYQSEEPSGQVIRQSVGLVSGLEKEDAKKITKFIKETKLKVTAQIQDDQVRVTGKKFDDLQEVISKLRSSDLGLPLNFTNMRS